MEWALDQLGNPVSASQRTLFSYGFRCGKCGEPVFRRSGPKRRPHFAHYGHSAKPECELYHPTAGLTTYGPKYAEVVVGPASSCTSLQGGLFLECKERGSYSLYMRLPQMPVNSEGVGEIEIRSGLGVRTYTASQLQRPRLIPVIPQIPVVEVTATGDLGAIGAVINAHVDKFRVSHNYFRGSETGGRLLAPEEPLEWGGSYRLLSQQPIGQIPEFTGLEVVQTKDMRGWYLYELILPSLSQMESEVGRETLTRILGRTIRAPHAHVYFVDPPPHHIEPDGTHVFPQTTTRFVLRRTEQSRISIYGSEQAIDSAHIAELGGEWVEITGLGIGDFTVLLDGREELLGRVEVCGLFQPRGVRVAFGNYAWEIFEPELRKAIRHGSYESLRVECPSSRVADRLALAQPVWAREGMCFILCGTPHGYIDADNFGSLDWTVPKTEGIEPPLIDAQIYVRRVWLEGLVARHGGPDALMCLRTQWTSSAIPVGYYESALHELSWLRPHILFSRFG
jgi:hypothetical protein